MTPGLKHRAPAKYALAAAVLGLCFLGGLKVYESFFRPVVLVVDKGISAPLAPETVTTDGKPLITPQFHLVDHHGRRQSLQQFRGKVLLIYFGYSFCPDICPAALQHMAEALGDMGVAAQKIQPLFITIDPQRDTVVHLKSYMSSFPDTFLALTGTEKEIQQAMQNFHVYGQKVQDASYTDYVMDHSSIVYVIDKEGKYLTSFNHETEPSRIKEILTEILI